MAMYLILQSGGLQFLQELNETVGGKLTEFITQINACYPPEVVEFYSPNYSKTLLQKVDEYQPGKALLSYNKLDLTIIKLFIFFLVRRKSLKFM
jgi:hypothetical protein